MGIFGSAIGVAGSIFGGIAASKAAKKAKRNIEAQQLKNKNWYDRRYNEDATQRADAQSILSRTEDMIRQRNKSSEGTASVMGGTDASIAATREANAKAISDATSTIAANAEKRKDNIEATYLENDNALQSQLNNIEQQRAKNIADAVQGATSIASSIGI